MGGNNYTEDEIIKNLTKIKKDELSHFGRGRLEFYNKLHSIEDHSQTYILNMPQMRDNINKQLLFHYTTMRMFRKAEELSVQESDILKLLEIEKKNLTKIMYSDRNMLIRGFHSLVSLIF